MFSRYERKINRHGLFSVKGITSSSFCFPNAGYRKVSVGTSIYSADHVLIAVGGQPAWPNIPGAEHGISSDGFFELEQLPK